ncbi:hypothetical protein [Ruminococcus flavefaciens]|uniref:hypothetical protein n=1 Tax=Ruminococcus flavefaciens TaxID=1265 RepID=UPI0026ED9E06|nr:hypothetical protein [Ruminococcus flavefaciens]
MSELERRSIDNDLNGYSTLSGQNGYLPLKFADSIKVENGKSGKGSVTFDNSALPSDFKAKGEVADGFTVSGSTVSRDLRLSELKRNCLTADSALKLCTMP